MILLDVINQASKTLKNNSISTHELDSQILLSNVLKIPKDLLITKDYIFVSKKNRKKFNQLIDRRIKKEPIAYIIGKKEFWSQNFIVNNSTLVPRPETELLIYKLVHYFKNKKINILDIGTGSGCILLTILKELPFSKGFGIDISPKAIQIAKKNAKKFNLINRVKLKVFDINKINCGKYDLIVSNPPYILSKDIKSLSKDIINYEPKIALDGGIDGLDLIKKVIYKSKHLLKRNGLFGLEIGFNQYRKVSTILRHCKFREISKEYDYKRNVRCIISTKKDFF